jgi:hypothetical protein
MMASLLLFDKSGSAVGDLGCSIHALRPGRRSIKRWFRRGQAAHAPPVVPGADAAPMAAVMAFEPGPAPGHFYSTSRAPPACGRPRLRRDATHGKPCHLRRGSTGRTDALGNLPGGLASRRAGGAGVRVPLWSSARRRTDSTCRDRYGEACDGSGRPSLPRSEKRRVALTHEELGHAAAARTRCRLEPSRGRPREAPGRCTPSEAQHRRVVPERLAGARGDSVNGRACNTR